jgi:hypothetical protein
MVVASPVPEVLPLQNFKIWPGNHCADVPIPSCDLSQSDHKYSKRPLINGQKENEKWGEDLFYLS